MEVTVIGIRLSSFSGSDGREISGANVYYTYPLSGCNGLACDRCWFPSRLEVLPSPGDRIRIYFTKNGKVSMFEPVSDAG